MTTKLTNQDVYTMVTDKIIGLLKKGTVPWRRPWRSDPASAATAPTNLVSKRPYTGTNVFLLLAAAIEHGFTSSYWVTYKQAQQLGGNVRKGAKSTMVVFWHPLDKTRRDVDADGKEQLVKDRVLLLRYYRVFNTDQCDGLQVPTQKPAASSVSVDNSPAEAILAGYPNPPTIRYGGDRAYYRHNTDIIQLPERAQFASADGYYCTAFHEAVHSTGHQKRLDRDLTGIAAFGDHNYSREELVAEMGAAFLCAHAGVDQLRHNASYIQGWCKALEDDVRAVIWAAGRAQKAADHILGVIQG